MESKDVYVYDYGDNLYINLTNRCLNDCQYCIRRLTNEVNGHYLWIKREPSAQEVISQLGVISGYKEIVFCGFGEPLIRLDALKVVARYCKEVGQRVRVNTNGLANLLYDCDITPQLDGLVDVVSISLPALDAEMYDFLCHPQFGPKSFEGMLEFARLARDYVDEVYFTIFDSMTDEEIARGKEIAKSVGAKTRIRHFIE